MLCQYLFLQILDRFSYEIQSMIVVIHNGVYKGISEVVGSVTSKSGGRKVKSFQDRFKNGLIALLKGEDIIFTQNNTDLLIFQVTVLLV